MVSLCPLSTLKSAMVTTARLEALRLQMKHHSVDAYYIPGEDAHQVVILH